MYRVCHQHIHTTRRFIHWQSHHSNWENWLIFHIRFEKRLRWVKFIDWFRHCCCCCRPWISWFSVSKWVIYWGRLYYNWNEAISWQYLRDEKWNQVIASAPDLEARNRINLNALKSSVCFNRHLAKAPIMAKRINISHHHHHRRISVLVCLPDWQFIISANLKAICNCPLFVSSVITGSYLLAERVINLSCS